MLRAGAYSDELIVITQIVDAAECWTRRTLHCFRLIQVYHGLGHADECVPSFSPHDISKEQTIAKEQRSSLAPSYMNMTMELAS